MRAKRFDGPLIVVESDTDPGDMGEPREFWSDEDKADVLIVPSVDLWPREGDPQLVEVKDGWAALGEGWAVFGANKADAIAKYHAAVQRHAEIAARPEPASREPQEQGVSPGKHERLGSDDES